jgi:hypothetical protein
MQALEHEKRLIRGLPLTELDAREAQRSAAATTIQACWRGARERQQLRATLPAFVSYFLQYSGLRPLMRLACGCPTAM